MSILALFLSFMGLLYAEPDCDQLKISVDISDRTKTVQVLASNGGEPYQYLFYGEDKKLLNRKSTGKNTITLKSKGKYNCTIIDSKGCLKKVEFEISR